MKPRVFSIVDTSIDFQDYYDSIQDFIKAVAGYDEMLPGKYVRYYVTLRILLFSSGMLSKSRSHVLCVAAVLHVLFSIDQDYTVQNVSPDSGNKISALALKIAIRIVHLSCQQTAYIAGKMELTEEKAKFTSGICTKFSLNY